MKLLVRYTRVIAAMVVALWALSITPVSATAAGPLLYVSNDFDNTVAVIDSVTGNKVTTIPVGNEPRPILAHPYNHKAYVANTYGESISVIDTTTNTVSKTIPLASGETVLTLAFNHAGTRLYAANWGPASTISIIDTANDTVLTTLSGFSGPQGMAFSNDDSTMYVVNENCCSGANRFVTVLDTSDYSVTEIIPLNGSSPTSIALTPDGAKAYISMNGGPNQGNKIAVLDTVAYTVTQYVTVETNPYGITTNSTGTRVYVVNTHYWDGGNNYSVNSTVSVIDTATENVIHTIPIGHVSNMLAISPDDSRVFAVLSSTGHSDTRLDLGRAPVRWSADRAGVHLPLNRPDGAPARVPGQAGVLGVAMTG